MGTKNQKKKRTKDNRYNKRQKREEMMKAKFK